MSKIVIIGVGHVGSHCAYSLAVQGIADEIVLLDINESKADCQAQDIADAGSLFPRRVQVRSGGYDQCQNADIVVIAAGTPRTPVQMPDGSFVPPPRLSLMEESLRAIQTIIPPLKASGFDGIIIGITNPADIVINYIYQKMDFPANRVFGTGTSLDTVRLKRYLSEYSGVEASRIECIALGEHGDSQTAPYSQMFIDGKSLSLLAAEDKQYDFDYRQAAQTSKTTGGRIIGGKGSTEFGIGTVLADMARAVLNDEKRIMPATVLLSGQYGISGLHAGVPAVIGRNGVESIVDLDLTREEIDGFRASCAVIESYLQHAKTLHLQI